MNTRDDTLIINIKYKRRINNMKNTNYPDYVNNKKGMRKIINNKYINCPNCGIELIWGD